jgi:hypothetical protein
LPEKKEERIMIIRLMIMKRLITICAIVTMILAVSGPAQAGVTVNWATGEVSKDFIGSDHTFPGDYDIVTLIADSDTLTLEYGTPQIVEINPLIFTVGNNAQNASTNPFTMTRDITINGVMGSLSNVVSNDMRVDISQADTLYVFGGPAVTFGNIIVTPLGWDNPLSVYQAGTATGEVFARFELIPPTSAVIIPAPGAILLGSIGVGLVGWMRRRRTL